MMVRATLCVLLLDVIMAPTRSIGLEATVITGATVIDCTGKPPVRDSVVVIEGGRIKAVGRKGKVSWSRGARVIDASGKFVLPGLIDMHVHYREWQGELFLASGVTGVKDLGNPVEWISEVSRMQAEGRLRGPRIFYVGNNLDARPPEGDHHVGIASAGESERAVRLLRELGAVAIKVRHKMSPVQLREITEAAHALGLPVTGHLARTNAMEAAMAGIDGLEHASGIAQAAAEATSQLKTDAKGISAFLEDLRGFALMNRDREAALIKLLIEKKVKLIPTLAIRRRAVLEDYAPVVQEDDSYARHPGLVYVPGPVRQEWSVAALDKRLREAFGQEEKRVMREGYHRLELFVREFHRVGGVILAGSDNMNSVPGLTLHRELESLVAAGLAPMAAVIGATRDAALFLRRDDLGSVEPGKTADLVIVAADPLDDIRNLRRIEKVFQGGREVERGFHQDYTLPPARPTLTRPLYLERLIATEK